MKLANLFFTTVLAGRRTTSPIDYLDNFVSAGVEILSAGGFEDLKGERWISRWQERMGKIADRLRRKFSTCGVERSSFTPTINTDIEDSCDALAAVLAGFAEWSDAHLAECGILVHLVLKCPSMYTTTTSSTAAPPTTTTAVPKPAFYHHTLKFDVADYFQRRVDSNSWPPNYPDNWGHLTSGAEVKISSVCNPDWVGNPVVLEFYGQYANCNAAEWHGWCDNRQGNFRDTDQFEAALIHYGTETENGYETALNCPQCGCTDTGIKKFDDVLSSMILREQNSGCETWNSSGYCISYHNSRSMKGLKEDIDLDNPFLPKLQ